MIPADEFRTPHGAILANQSCAHHCVDCEGDDHHWMPECPEDGDPVMVCKHCDAWREMTDEDDELSADGWMPDGSWAPGG